MNRAALVVTLVCSFACGGLFAEPDPVELEARKDLEDTAEQKRLAGDYAGAEAELKRRLNADPTDARSWRLLGDVNFTRGQYFQQKWKENLGWAWEAYSGAVTLEPTSCLTWGRLAFVAAAAAENPQTAIPREKLDALPLAEGWQACPGAALLDLEFRRAPTDAERSAAGRGLTGDAPTAHVLAAAAPWMVEAVKKVELSGVAWKEVLARPNLGPGGFFVVLPKEPLTAGSIDGSQPRQFTYPEWISVGSVSGGRIVFLDRRFPERVPASAITRGPACRASWELRGADNIPVGSCGAGPHDPRASEIYDESLLRPAGKAHFHHPSIAPATISWDTVAEGSVNCLGGPVGRMFVDTPSCRVGYDRAIPQHRSLSWEGTGLTATSREHAEHMVEAARSAPLFGEATADHLAHGRLGPGLPYAVVGWSLPDLTGCKGRGIYQKAKFEEGAVEFVCQIGSLNLAFRELTLIDVTVGGS